MKHTLPKFVRVNLRMIIDFNVLMQQDYQRRGKMRSQVSVGLIRTSLYRFVERTKITSACSVMKEMNSPIVRLIGQLEH